MKILSKLFEIKKSEEGAEGFINDRRYAKRYDIPLKVNYLNPVTNCPEETFTKNICRTGIRFRINTKITKGVIISLKIENPYGFRPISSKAVVLWSEKFATGDNSEDVIYETGAKLFKKYIF